jgi:RNA polymerase sigma-70 factor, ECF subfamily
MATVAIPPTSSDEACAERARAGDRRAFHALVLRYQHRIFGMAMHICANTTDAEDITQETFLQAFRGISSWKGDAKFSTWLHRIGMNAALMKRRADRRRPAEPLSVALPNYEDRGSRGPCPGDHWMRGDLVLERKWIARAVREALAGLDFIYRAAFVLHLEGLPVQETARLLGTSETAIRKRVHRARIILRAQLRPLMPAA